MSGNLLIVDDEPQICAALTRLLRTDGYSISHALNPVEGIKLMNDQPFDVVISDYMMPGVNGVEFLSEVSRSFPDTIRLMLSGQADMSTVIDAINSGSIFKFILKPWSNDGIRNTIKEAFQQSAQKNRQFDEESGWLNRSRFLDQDVSEATGAIMVVGEWIDAASCIADLDSAQRRSIYSLLTQRIEQVLDITGTIGLVEQGTFACVAADAMSDYQWQHLCAELNKKIDIEPGNEGDSRTSFRASFRLGLSRLEGEDSHIPLKQALIAVGNATTGTSQFYTRQLGSQVHRRRTLESDLHSAIERGQLFYELQPQMNALSKEITSAESLLRWRHPRLGLISPLDIIDMAEQSELINDIGHWIARECCELLASWANTSHQTKRLSVNISPRQFLSGDVISDIQRLITEHRVKPECLEVEITESCVMSNPDECATRLNTLTEIGVRIALDDFGTGHSSLSTLSQLPIDVLKIDRSFISELNTIGDTAHTLLEHIVGLAKSLDLEVVAEGIETSEQAKMCTDLGCDLLQGFLISKPIAVEDFARLSSGPH